MFGTVLADRSHLTEAQMLRYRAVYCGLCHAIGKEYGPVARMTLSYDMTFLILLHQSLYEPQECRGKQFCVLHPRKARDYHTTPFTDYAAAMNVALAYYKALDDWKDERSLPGALQVKLLSEAMKKIAAAYPKKCAVIKACLDDLGQIEQQNILDPDRAAACFGRLTGELFVIDPADFWADTLRKLGDALGRFIYLSDALTDLQKDLKKNRYNPLKAITAPETEENFLPTLQLTIGDCAAELEKLPLVQDIEILRNIIYSGVWIPYLTHRKKKERK